MSEGIIRKALSGFYYVDDGQAVTTCRARGKHRHARLTPLVGDRVRFTPLEDGSGALDEIKMNSTAPRWPTSTCWWWWPPRRCR